MAKKPAKTEAPKPVEKAVGSSVHARHIAAALDAVGRSLTKTFAGFGFVIVLFDKRKPDQHQHFLGGDGKAAATAMTAAIKKIGP